MPETPSLYDLTLLLSMTVEDERRSKIVADVESAIAAGGGSVERHDRWGRRQMTYRINHQAEAEYHLLQFQGPPALLDSLSHTLRIDDAVLRFRIIKVLPGTPEPPASGPPASGPPAAAAPASPAPAQVPAAVAAESDDGEE
jgi:small subunit ribosomal protein S6